jgi:stage V sporulation protein AD
MATIGKVRDSGVQDSNDMGSAMAPAAFDTIMAHLADSGRDMADYDCVVTGDLGALGSKILLELLKKAETDTGPVTDCGLFVYDKSQDAHSGGSGCGCSAVVLGPLFLEGRWKKALNRVLFVGTGALLSPTTAFQGETIPAIAHAVCLERGEGRG